MPPASIRTEFRKGLTLYRNGRNPECLPHLKNVMSQRRADPRMIALSHKMTAEIYSRQLDLKSFSHHLDKSLKYHPKAYWGQVSNKKSVNHLFRMGLHRYTHRRRISASSLFEALLKDCKFKYLPILYTMIADVKSHSTTEDELRSLQLIQVAVHQDPKFGCAREILMHYEIERAFAHYCRTHPCHDEI